MLEMTAALGEANKAARKDLPARSPSASMSELCSLPACARDDRGSARPTTSSTLGSLIIATAARARHSHPCRTPEETASCTQKPRA